MTITPYGDSAILINFEQRIDEKINAEVIAMSNAITSELAEDVKFCIPAYCSITIGFDPVQIKYKDIVDKINSLYLNLTVNPEKSKSRIIHIPVCYEGGFAVDKTDVLIQTNLSWSKIIELHTSRVYRVYMIGFIAGFAYMGTLSQALACNRKESPKMNIPSGSVGIAGLQTGIYPVKAHAGWQLIGRTPITVFDVKMKNPFLFHAGDRVQFSAIDPEMYASILANIESGNFDNKSVITYV